ncbi:MAG: YcjX family protein, partial [Pararhodobacter sp.]
MGIGSDVMEGLGLGDPVVRIGVTGLSRAGKTVFITSLVANLLERGRMQALRAASDGRLRAVWLQPQPDDTIPRFDYERHLAALTGPDPHWPDGTRHVSQLRLSMRLQGSGLLSGLRGARNLHVDIVDYPGEWLLDLRLMERDFAAWSDEVLGRITGRPGADRFAAALAAQD